MVIIPRCDDIDLETFLIPRNWKFWRSRILFLDDLHKYVDKKGFERLFRAFLVDTDTIIVATCRSGIEYKKIKVKIGGSGIDPAMIFGGPGIELKTITEEEGEKIADAVNRSWADVKFNFNGTVGSIFLPLREMKIRFGQCNSEEKTILRAIKRLFDSGIYKAKQFFPLGWIKIACSNKGLEGEDYEWSNWLERLKEKEFVKLEADGLWVEEVYLEDIVKLETEQTKLQVLEEMSCVFADIPEAIFPLGNKAWDIGTVELEKAEFMKIAIEAYDKALEVRTRDRYPMDYGMTQNNLGNAYQTLAEVEGKAENSKRAIGAYEEALKVRTRDKFPIQYGTMQNNLGGAYTRLAEVEAKTENSKRAIEAYDKALEVRTRDKFPMDYAMTQNNLGTAYRTLAEVEAKTENSKRAIEAYEEALKIYTESEYPEIFPLVERNLKSVRDFCGGD